MAFGSLVLATSIFFLGIAVLLNSTDFSPKEFSLPPPPEYKGTLAQKNVKGAERLLEGKVPGPESIVVEKDTLYTCLIDGRCVKIVDGKIRKIVKLTTHANCNGDAHTFEYCGRPLGLRKYKDNRFVVADATLGLFFIDFEKGTHELILPANINVEGERIKFPDDLDFVDDDTIIFTDVSTKYSLDKFMLIFLEHIGDGRLIQHKISTGENKVLLGGLNFPNGVQIHPDKASVLFCESGTGNIHRYYFSGPKKGKREVFAANLPGFPDNIRASANGKSLYVALFSSRSKDKLSFFDKAAQWPLLRKLLGTLYMRLPDSLMFRLLGTTSEIYGIFVELDLNGKIVNSYHDPEGKVIHFISEIADDGGKYLYLGSFANNYIGRVLKH